MLVSDDERAAVFAARRAPRASLQRGHASFAVVGRGIGLDPALPTRVAALAERAGVALTPAPGDTSSASLAYLVPATALTAVVRAVHAGLFGATPTKESGELLPHPHRSAPSERRG